MADIARTTELDVTTCEVTLTRLLEIGLVHNEAIAGVSRRTVLRGAAKVGVAGVAAAPIVSTLIPVAAAHASTGGTGGGTPPPSQTVTYTIQSGTNDGKGPNDGYQDSAIDGTPDGTNQTSTDRASWVPAGTPPAATRGRGP